MFQKLLEAIALALEKRSIEYMVIGGQALLVYGEPRLTQDIDITLALGVEGLPKILELTKELRWKTLVESPQDFVQNTMVLPCRDVASGIRIDLIFSHSPYESQAFGRIRKIRVGKANVCFAAVEDLIIHKIVAARPRDLEDVKNVLIKNPKIDLDYLKKWLNELGTSLSLPLWQRLQEIRKDTPA